MKETEGNSPKGKYISERSTIYRHNVYIHRWVGEKICTTVTGKNLRKCVMRKDEYRNCEM
jgi:hypothetical protein